MAFRFGPKKGIRGNSGRLLHAREAWNDSVKDSAITTSKITSGAITSDHMTAASNQYATTSSPQYWHTGGQTSVANPNPYDQVTEMPDNAPPTLDQSLVHLANALGLGVEKLEDFSDLKAMLLITLVEQHPDQEVVKLATAELETMGHDVAMCPRCELHVQEKDDYLCRECR